jgi:hypothetical protein
MLLYTSLSPSASAVAKQRECIESWLAHGHEVVCVQGRCDDIAASIDGLPVQVIRTKPTMAGSRPKAYVGLDAILDAFLLSGADRCGIINGDIEIYDPDGLIDAEQRGLACVRRYDHDGDLATARVFPSGFDLFLLDRSHAESVPRSMFVIGQTFWDYWLPWSCLQAGHILTTIDAPVIYHRRHALNYAHQDWLRTVHHFCWLTNRSTNVQAIRISTDVHTAINRAIAQTQSTR